MSEEEPAGSTWLSTSQVAARLGCSERTVQRRCKRGTLPARLVATSDGQEWQIEAAALEAAAKGAARGAATNDTPDSSPSEQCRQVPTIDDRGADTSDEVPTGGASSSVGSVVSVPTGGDSAFREEAASTFNVHLLQENAFLRGVIEQQQRDAAELRAALREALKISTRALPEPQTEPTSTSGPSTAPSTSAPIEGKAGTGITASGTATGEASAPSTSGDSSQAQRFTRPARPLWMVILGWRPRR